jgi:hypothetical protein
MKRTLIAALAAALSLGLGLAACGGSQQASVTADAHAAQACRDLGAATEAAGTTSRVPLGELNQLRPAMQNAASLDGYFPADFAAKLRAVVDTAPGDLLALPPQDAVTGLNEACSALGENRPAWPPQMVSG